jgi:hypothetical membrane protein
MRTIGLAYAAVYLMMILVAFILPFFSAESYSIVGNSLSELGAQDTPGSWVMNLVFILLSIVTVLLATRILRRFWFQLYLLYFFALALFFTAIYHHAPIDRTVYLEREHLLHSIFSFVTGTAFSVYCVAVAFIIKEAVPRASAIFMFCLAIGLSVLMLVYPDYRGIFQRVLFITAFGWLFYSLVSFKFENRLKKV